MLVCVCEVFDIFVLLLRVSGEEVLKLVLYQRHHGPCGPVSNVLGMRRAISRTGYTGRSRRASCHTSATSYGNKTRRRWKSQCGNAMRWWVLLRCLAYYTLNIVRDRFHFVVDLHICNPCSPHAPSHCVFRRLQLTVLSNILPIYTQTQEARVF